MSLSQEKALVPNNIVQREEDDSEIPSALRQSISHQGTVSLSIKAVPLVIFLTTSDHISENQKSSGKAKPDQYRKEWFGREFKEILLAATPLLTTEAQTLNVSNQSFKNICILWISSEPLSF